jgi:hypothetical protein
MSDENYITAEALDAGLDSIKESPKSAAILDLIVLRPGVDLREMASEAQLDEAKGLVGDSWIQRGSARTPDGRAHPEMQITIMNARLISLIAGSKDRWQLAGDQLFTELDLSASNLPAGSRLRIGKAIVEITSQPHTG